MPDGPRQPDTTASTPLPFAVNCRLSADQRELLEQTAQSLDLTLSGAIRWHLDQALDAPLNEKRDAPTRRELMHEADDVVEIDGQPVEIVSASRAD